MDEKMNNGRDNVEVDLRKLLMLYLRKWWLVAVCAVVVGGAVLAYTTFFVTPQYRANTTIYVNSFRSDKSDELEYVATGNLNASKMLVGTYIRIISSNTVLDRVIEQAKLEQTADEIRSIMTAEQVDETEMFRVYITHPDPQVAADVANAIAKEAPSAIQEYVEGSSAKVVDYAIVPTTLYSPNYYKNTLVGCLVGAVLAAIYLTVLYVLDVRIRTAEDLKALFDIPVLGQIPEFLSPETKGAESGYSRKAYGYTSGNKNT